MPRTVWPNAFQLRTCELSEVFADGRATKVVKNFLPTIPGKHVKAGEDGPPVALRWFTAPNIGFPRQAFEVFRRPPSERFRRLVELVAVNGIAFAEWGLIEMYEVRFSAAPDPGRTLVVEALDRTHEVIVGQRIVFNSGTETGRFRISGIAALRITGRGSIRAVLGLNQNELANSVEWERIQVVGLPFTETEIAGPVYDPGKQGIEPPSMNGLDFAKIRLQIAELLHLVPPPTGIAGIPTPSWPAPDPVRYLEQLRDPNPSSLGLIRECLENSKDEDLEKLQMNYVHHEVLPGIQQVDIEGAPPGPEPTETDIPVVAVTMMSVSSDSYGATGLGYGTVDFPRRDTGQIPPTGFREPPGTVHTPFFYMVTTTIIFPFGQKFDVAALGQTIPLPEATVNLTAATLQQNRPAARDLAASEAVQLKWDLSLQPQGYGVAVSRKAGEIAVLNPSRGEPGGFNTFVPLRPDEVNGQPPAGVQSTFVDPIAPVPLTGAATSRYIVAGLDVFGRWSSWRVASHTIAALPVSAPGLHSANILQNGASAGRIVPSKIEIEFSWEWTDRSADRVEFSGAFFSATGTPPGTATGFALNAAGAPGPNVVVHFNAAGNPSIGSDHLGSVLQLDSLPGADPNQRRYRLTVEGRPGQNCRCDFTSVAEVAYAVFARGVERIRPTEFSAPVGPLVTHFADPIPPVQPTLPIDLRWAALPDAAGRAHAVLSWPAAANAAGYIVWQATEAALHDSVDPTLPEPAPGTSIFDRATILTQLVTAFITPESAVRAARSMKAFSRVNTELVRTTKLELDLPGRADTIFAYRVSSVSASNIESPRSSSVALFAVPRRNQPGQPSLMLRTVNNETERGIAVLAFPGTEPRTIGFRVYRVRNSALLNDVGLMGPPKIAHDNPAWRDFDLRQLDGTIQRGRAILDPVSENWYPYYYRIVALGVDDPARGEYRGESIASAVQQAFLTPAAPPFFETFEIEANSTNKLLSFTTNLPVKPTPLGVAKIELVQIAEVGGRMARNTVLSVAAEKISVGPPLSLLASPTPAELDAMPEINRREPDAAGVASYSLRVRAEVDQGSIVVTDPLGRTREVFF